MKRIVMALFIFLVPYSTVFAQSEAGAIFLLIAPGARAGGMGEAHRACRPGHHPHQASQETPVQDIRRTSELYKIESQELWRRLGDPS